MNDLIISAAEALPKTYFTFRVNDRLYGIDVAHVREVSTQVMVSPVPQAPPIVRGLANLRSRIFLVLDLRVALGLPATTCTPESRLIVLQARVAEQVGLLVDKGGEILRVSPSQMEEAPRGAGDLPESLVNRHSPLVTGVCKLDNELMMMIDPLRLVEATDQAIRL